MPIEALDLASISEPKITPEVPYELIETERCTLIGTYRHSNRRAELSEAHLQTYQLAVSRADIVCVEGRKDLYKGVGQFDDLAHDWANDTGKPIYYLEEGTRSEQEIATDYGLDALTYAVLREAVYMIDQRQTLFKRRGYRDRVIRRLMEKPLHADLIGTLDPHEVFDRVEMLYKWFDTRIPRFGFKRKLAFLNTTRLQTCYLSALRDFELMCPQLRQLLYSHYQESIVTVTGQEHLRNLKAVVEGEEVLSPPRWDDFIASLSPFDQKSINMVLSAAKLQ